MMSDDTPPPMPEQLEPDTLAIREALELFRPRGALLLTAIYPAPGRPVEGRQFLMPDELEDAVEWAAELNLRGYGVYWTPNWVDTDARPKASKEQVVAVAYLWADVDPNLFRHGGSYEAARAEVLERAKELARVTSFLVDSGHGVQPFWAPPEPIAVTAASAHQCERLNERLAAWAGAPPGCHNLDRVMRLPGTVNYPSQSKITRGYPAEPCMARLLSVTGQTWSLPALGSLSSGAVDLQARLGEYLDAHPRVRARYEGSDEGLVDTSGSGRDMGMVAMLRAGGWELEEVREVLADWPHGSIEGRLQGDRYWRRMWDRCHAAQEPAQAPITPPPVGEPLAGLPWGDTSPSDPPPVEVLQRILAERQVSMWLAGTNVGKSASLLDVAVSIATGQPWRGDHKVQQGAVIYVAAESPSSIIARTLAIRARARALGLDLDDLPIYITTASINLMREQGQKFRRDMAATLEHVEQLWGLPVRLAIVDTLATAAPGAKENDSDTMGAISTLLMECARTIGSAHWALAHHLGKDATKGSRGHSSLPAAIDTEIRLVRQESGIVVATVEKQRSLPSKGFTWAFRLEGVETGRVTNFGEIETQPVVIHCEATPDTRDPMPKGLREALRAYVAAERRSPGGTLQASIEDWRREFYEAKGGGGEGPRKALRRAIDAMTSEGAIIEVGAGLFEIGDGCWGNWEAEVAAARVLK